MKGSTTPTALGLLALLFWSSAVAFTRSISETLGTLNTAFFSLLLSGLLLFIMLGTIYKKEFFMKISRFPLWYLYKVGSFWIIYEVAFCLAVGEATSRKAAITVGIINYLWPGFIYLFALPLLKQKARPVLLALGILTASSGAAAALMHGSRLSPADIFSTVKDNMLPYALAFIAAISWGIYSNLVRKYKTEEDIFSLPVLCIISAGIILVVQLLKGEVPVLAPVGWGYLELAYFVLFPKALAYLFWYKAMGVGRKNLVTSFSFLVPLVSMLLSSIYLDVEIGFGFMAAAVLVVVGALLCKVSIKE